MNAKFIIEQIVMSMSFLKADMFREHKFIKQEDEHGMYKCLKAVINHPETGYLQNKVGVATILEDIKEKLGSVFFNWSYLLDVLSEINKLENIEEHKEVLESFYYWMFGDRQVTNVDLFLGVMNQDDRADPREILVRAFQGQYLNLHLFNETIERAFDLNLDKQIELLVDIFNIPRTMFEQILEKQDSSERRAFTISSLRSFLFDKETTLPEPKGDTVSDDTQTVQEILNKPTKDEEMKQEQFYTKLYFYSDAKRIVFSDGKIQDIADCFSKLSVVDQADVCNQFGITATSIKYVPGIATVLATMFMNMEMQVLKRKLSDLVSHGFIGELHGRIEQCETWEDANKLHQYVMTTFNGMQVESVKDIIVKHFGLDNYDQFQHDGTQLAGFFAGVIFADAMSMVQRKEEHHHLASHYQPCDADCPSCSRKKDPLDQAVQPKILASVKETRPEESEFHTLGNALRELLGKTYPSAQQQDENDIMNRQLDKVMGGQYSKDTPHVIVVSYI
ncbi:MAG: hypothetical protein ACRCVV_10970 [Shewanella sp.]